MNLKEQIIGMKSHIAKLNELNELDEAGIKSRVDLVKKLGTSAGCIALAQAILNQPDRDIALADARYMIKSAFQAKKFSHAECEKYTHYLFEKVQAEIFVREAINALEKETVESDKTIEHQ